MPMKRLGKDEEPEELFGDEEIDLVEEEIVSKEVEKPTQPAKKQFILKSQQVDKFTVIRTRQELTPSMCKRPHCRFDAASNNGFTGWNDEDLDEATRAKLLQVLAKHDEVVHSKAEDIILNEDEIPTTWLGDKNSNKRLR